MICACHRPLVLDLKDSVPARGWMRFASLPVFLLQVQSTISSSFIKQRCERYRQKKYDARRFAVALVHAGPKSPRRSLPGHVHCSADEVRRRDFHSLRNRLYPRYLSLHHHTEIDRLVDVLILCELGVLGHLVDRRSKGLSLHHDRHNGNLVEVRHAWSPG